MSTHDTTRDSRGAPDRSAEMPAKARRRSVVVGANPEAATGAAMSEVRVLCVDDHEVLIEGLRAQFAIDGKLRVIGSLSSADRLLDEAEKLRPDVVLLDIEMPGPDVFEAADRLHRALPALRIVFLSAHIRDGYIAAAYKCGAHGYFAKGDELQAIVAGIYEVARGKPTSDGARAGAAFVMGPKVRERCLAPITMAAGVRHVSAKPAPAVIATPLTTLSERETEVLRLIGKGKSRGEIAAELSRSPKTIDGHQDRLMKKLGIATRAELMRFAIREGLAEA